MVWSCRLHTAHTSGRSAGEEAAEPECAEVLLRTDAHAWLYWQGLCKTLL